MAKKGLLIILSGPSGVGKGTIRKLIIDRPELNLAYSISMTTRKPRNREVDGLDYYFVDKKTFEDNIKKGNFLEYCEFVGNYYGTPLDKVNTIRETGKNVFLEIEINGAEQVMAKTKGEDVVSIFLLPPSLKALEERIRKRKTESESVILQRLKKARSEMNKNKNYDYTVVNDDADVAANKIAEIILEHIKLNELN